MHCLHYVAKLKPFLVCFYSFYTLIEVEENKLCVLASDDVE